jgi:HEAT repeat protein
MAQEAQKEEPAKEATVQAEPAENAVKSDEVNNETPAESPVKAEVKKEEPKAETPKAEEVKKEAPKKEAAKPVEKKAPAKELSKEQYMADLSGTDEAKIIAAEEWLGDKGEKTAVPQLTNLLKSDKRVRVRVYASVALGLIADEKSIPALNEALTADSSADVRYSVLLSIHRINPAKSIDALKKAKETETDPFIKDYLEKMEAKVNEKK